jgi:hypothetical protein
MAFNPLGLFGQNPVPSATPLTDAEKLAQVMGGNLSGTLTGADKLMGLSALLKSVARGSQTTPQQAIAQLQQQKSAELQNRITIDQARKQAERAALMKAQKDQIISTLPAEMQAEARLIPDEVFFASYGKKFERFIAPETYAPTEQMKNAAAMFPVGSAAYRAYLDALSGVGKTVTTPEGLVQIPGVPIARSTVVKNGKPINVVVIGGKVFEE